MGWVLNGLDILSGGFKRKVSQSRKELYVDSTSASCDSPGLDEARVQDRYLDPFHALAHV